MDIGNALNGIAMELVIRKIGNSTGLTLPTALLRDLGLSVGQVMSLDKTADGALVLRVNALCDLNAPMPEDLIAWDNVESVGNETP